MRQIVPPAAPSLAEFFDLSTFGPPYANTSWSTLTQSSAAYHGGWRASAGGQNNSVTFKLPSPLRGGSWDIRLLHRAGAACGIYHVAVSADGTSFTDVGTVDGYAASDTTVATNLAGVMVPNGTRFIRFTMASKNASASSYTGRLSGFAGLRTGG